MESNEHARFGDSEYVDDANSEGEDESTQMHDSGQESVMDEDSKTDEDPKTLSSNRRVMCCNPLHPPKHDFTKDSRRHKVYPIRPWLKSKYGMLYPRLMEGTSICGTCELTLKKEAKELQESMEYNPQHQPCSSTQSMEPEYTTVMRSAGPEVPNAVLLSPTLSLHSSMSDASFNTTSDVDSLYETQSTIAEDANSFLQSVAVSPLLRLEDNEIARKYLKAKNSARRALFEPLLSDQSTELSPDAGSTTTRCSNTRKCVSCDELVQDLQTKFSTACREDQFKMLTVLPANLTPTAIKNLFHCSLHMAKKALKLRGTDKAFSSPTRRQHATLSEDIIKLVQEFYLSEANSRINPDFRRTVRVRPKDGGAVTYEAGRYIMTTLKELFHEFKDENPEVKISISKFASLRPQQCIWSGLKALYNTCTCEPHQNFKLLLAACDKQNVDDINEILSPIFCSTSSSDCMLGYCEECPHSEAIENLLIDIDDDLDTITFKMWGKDKDSYGVQLHTKILERNEFVEHLKNFIPKFASHHFKTKEQKKFIAELKTRVLTEEHEAIMWVDFAMNYNCVVQDAPQSFHWVNLQITLLPCVVMYGNDGTLRKKKYVVVSDCLTHDATTFQAFRARIIDAMKVLLHKVNHVYVISDGTAAQFKNTKNLINTLYHEAEFELTVEHHCTTTAHGKSECDGLGAICKKSARLASLALDPARRREILNAKDFHDFIKSKFSSDTVESLLVTQQDIQNYMAKQNIEERYAQVKPIKGTSKCHGFIPIDGETLKMKELSTHLDGARYHVLNVPARAQSDSQDASEHHEDDESQQQYQDGDWVAVKHSGWFVIGRILRCTDDELEVATMKQSHKANQFTRFSLEKIVTCDRVDILMKIAEPTPNRIERYLTLTAADYKLIEKMCK